MKTLPRLGTPVLFQGNLLIMRCRCTVEAHYPGHTGRNEDGEYIVPDMVSLRPVKKLPTWPYPDRETFCAELSEISPA